MSDIPPHNTSNHILCKLPKQQKEQVYYSLLFQLKSRNSHNMDIINDYINKINKKQTYILQRITCNRSINRSNAYSDKIEIETLKQPLQAVNQVQLQQTDKKNKHNYNRRDSYLLKTTDVVNEEVEMFLHAPASNKIHVKQKQLKNSISPAYAAQQNREANFIGFLKNVYMKEWLEKARSKKLRNYRIDTIEHKHSSSKEEIKYINFNCLAFPTQDSTSSPKITNNKCNRISTEGNKLSDGTISKKSYRINNSFLPSIARQVGKIKKRDLPNLQHQQKDEYQYKDSHGCVLQFLQQNGPSLRISGLQIKKQLS